MGSRHSPILALAQPHQPDPLEPLQTILDCQPQRGQTPIQLPRQLERQQAHQGVASGTTLLAQEDRSQLQQPGFERAKIPLHFGQVQVAVMHLLRVRHLLGQVALDDVAPVQFGLLLACRRILRPHDPASLQGHLDPALEPIPDQQSLGLF